MKPQFYLSLYCIVLVAGILFPCCRARLILNASTVQNECPVSAKNSSPDNSTITMSLLNTSHSFVWLRNGEGIFTHLVQIEGLYQEVVIKNNKELVVGSSPSGHYRDHQTVNLCEVFEFRIPHLTCTTQKPADIVKAVPCYITSEPTHWGIPFDIRKSNSSLQRVPAIDFSKMGCFAGIYHGKGPFIYPEFQKKFRTSFEYYKNVLGFKKSSSYAVVHWRRGDQLYTRCSTQGSGGIKDRSLNCKSVDVFSAGIKKSALKYGLLLSQVYVSTNEENKTAISYLEQQGLKTMHSIPCIFSTIEAIALDVQLMIDATYYIGQPWASTIHRVVDKARIQNGKSGMLKYLD